MVPAGATIDGGASVASTAAVGVLPGAAAAVVGVGSLPEGNGVAVAEDPQATNKAAIIRTKA